MQIKTLTPDYAVDGQIRPEDVASLKEAGFVAIVCNRPDTETSQGEDSATIAAAAKAAGLAFTYNPVVNGALTQANVTNQGRALAEAAGPVFAYCRSGMRSAVVWALSQSPVTPTEHLITAAAQAGYDLSPMRSQIEAAGQTGA